MKHFLLITCFLSLYTNSHAQSITNGDVSLFVVDLDGVISDPADPVGSINSQGYIFNSIGDSLGYIDGSTMYLSTGYQMGSVLANGDVVSSSGTHMGSIDNSGNVNDGNGNNLGNIGQISRVHAAAIMFFFF